MITGVGHTAYRTKDIDASLEFYGKLGLTEAFRMHRPDGSLGIIYMLMNGGQFIELFPNGAESVQIGPQTIGYAHLCLEVDDMEKTVAEIEAKGIVLDRPIKQGGDGNYQAWIVDPDGNRIELMQIAPDSRQAKARRAAAGAS
jgi:lactoylglutathione lyase